jgi:hypothetical protein
MHKNTNFDSEMQGMLQGVQGCCRGGTWEVDSDLMKNKRLKTESEGGNVGFGLKFVRAHGKGLSSRSPMHMAAQSITDSRHSLCSYSECSPQPGGARALVHSCNSFPPPLLPERAQLSNLASSGFHGDVRQC